MSAPQPAMPALIGKRKAFMLFAPLAILLSAAVVTNFGGGVAKDANAATVNVTANVQSAVTMTPCADIGFGNINAGTVYTQPCDVSFGSTNAASTLNVHASSAGLFTGFAATGTTCAAVAAGQLGFRANAAGTATETAGYDCTSPQARALPTAAFGVCTAPSGPNLICDMDVVLNTGTVASGARSGTLTINAV